MAEPHLLNLEFNNQQMRDLIGKRVLVGITHRNMNDEVVALEQFQGAIDRFSLDEGLVLKLTNGAERIIPPDLSRLHIPKGLSRPAGCLTGRLSGTAALLHNFNVMQDVRLDART